MKMILLQDVKSVGKKGDLVNVSEGYAKNFLLPKKLGVEATKSNLNDYELKQKADAKRKQEELEKAQATAKELEDKVVTIKVKTGGNGKLFGSVTNKEVAEAIVEQTKLKIDGNIVTMSRSGIEGGNTFMVFENGKTHMGHYETPYGSFTVSTFTDKMKVDIGETEGDIRIDYFVDIDNVPQSANSLSMSIREA